MGMPLGWLSPTVLVATLAVAALATIGTTVVTAAPAQANDITLRIRSSDGEVLAKAWYDDLTDNLCIWTAISVGFARIGPEGGSFPHVVGADGNTSCTGNLSIPEDALWRIRLDWRGAVRTDTFYT